MATSKSRREGSGRRLSLDLSAWFRSLGAQFQGLDPKEPGQWPLLPKLAAWAATTALTVVAGWFLVLSDVMSEVRTKRDREPALKTEYRTKLAQAINLEELRKQKLQVQEYVGQLERQLPSRAEMDALLLDINQAGVGRGLLFESFRPGQPVIKDYYAELPIAIKVTGRFHDLGAFSADLASLSRIVTLDGLSLEFPAGAAPGGGGGSTSSTGAGGRLGEANLSLEATARTYRYLDNAESEARLKARGGKAARK